MKKKTLVMTMLVMLSGYLPLYSHAEDTMAEEEAIKADCKEESKNAESPEIYYEECVADKLQALKDSQGGSGDVPPEKG